MGITIKPSRNLTAKGGIAIENVGRAHHAALAAEGMGQFGCKRPALIAVYRGEIDFGDDVVERCVHADLFRLLMML
jgi:hypothetical protein